VGSRRRRLAFRLDRSHRVRDFGRLSGGRDRGQGHEPCGSHRRSPRRSLKSGSGNVRPYVGGGAGLASALVWTDVAILGFASDFAWERALAYQAFAGVEVHRRWLVETVFRRTYATAASVQVNPVGPDHAFSIAAGVTW